MKIKGVHSVSTKVHRRGDVIEYSPAEKVPLAVGDALRSTAPAGEVFVVKSVTAATPIIHPKSSKIERPYANNVYTAQGTVVWQRNILKPDKLMAPQTAEFKIEFEDAMDTIGQPDLKVRSFEII